MSMGCTGDVSILLQVSFAGAVGVPMGELVSEWKVEAMGAMCAQ